MRSRRPSRVTPSTPFEQLPLWLRFEDLAVWWDVPVGVIRTMAHAGAFPVLRVGRFVRVERKALAAFLETQSAEPRRNPSLAGRTDAHGHADVSVNFEEVKVSGAESASEMTRTETG